MDSESTQELKIIYVLMLLLFFICFPYKTCRTQIVLELMDGMELVIQQKNVTIEMVYQMANVQKAMESVV